MSKKILSNDNSEILQIIFDFTPDALIVCDTDGRIVKTNARAWELFGYSSGELDGNNIEMLLPERFRQAHQSKRESYSSNPVSQPMGSGIDFFALKKDGIEIPIDIALQSSEIDGQLYHIASIRDISYFKEVIRKLAISERGLNEAQSMVKMGHWELDLVNNELYWSDQVFDIFGLKPTNSHASYETFLDYIHPDDRDLVDQAYQLHLTKKEKYDITHRFLLPSGEVKYARELAETEYNSKGKPIRSMGTVSDVTDYVLKEKQLKNYIKRVEISNKELEQFAYVASHDLQEPLRTITSHVDFLSSNLGDNCDEDIQQSLSFIHQAAGRMSVLITELLNYSRIGVQLNKADIHVKTMIDRIIKELGEALDVVDHEVIVEGVSSIYGDPTLIAMVLGNLLSNAVKYRRNGQKLLVKVSVKEFKNSHVLHFDDNGIGIEKEYRKNVFSLFQRLHPQSEIAGSGIGLSHCRKIVEVHEGEIWIETNKWDGCRVCIKLPKN